MGTLALPSAFGVHKELEIMFLFPCNYGVYIHEDVAACKSYSAVSCPSQLCYAKASKHGPGSHFIGKVADLICHNCLQ